MDESDEEISRRVSKQLGFPVICRHGWIVRQGRGGPPITNEIVEQWLYEADMEDAGLNPDGSWKRA